MAGGYCLRWTVWRVWLHPFKALRRLLETDKTEADLRQRLDETLEMLEKQRKETSIQSFKVSELLRLLTDTDKRLADEHRELEETRLKLTKALDSLAEHKSVDEKLAEFNKELSKVEDLKRRYEKRITELEARLGDARKRLAVADDSELVEPIDMADTRRFPAGPPKLRPNGSSPRFISPNNRRVPHHSQGYRGSFITRYEEAPRITHPESDDSSRSAQPASSTASEQSKSAVNPADVTRPYYEEKDTTTIEGTPAETSEKVAAYLKSLQKNTPKKRAGRSDDDWLSELPDL
ncbi:MAG: hypothetical protein HDS48_07360 [Bacteroides sp.]|nr:hypothetical protein [Bacteroides sp.]